MAGSPISGDRIVAHCTRCDDNTGHVIVALVGDDIVKVQCCACGSVHKYYPPHTAEPTKDKICRVKQGEDRKEAVSATKRSTSAAHSRATRNAIAKAQKAVLEIEHAWQRAMENATTGNSHPYSMDASFAIGDIIEHPKFGSGVVQKVFPPNKMQVLFRDGTRLMRCSC